MPLISIKRFLDQNASPRNAEHGGSVHAAACAELIGAVEARLLAGDGYAELRSQWSALVPMLGAMREPAGLAEFQAQASVVLAERERLEGAREQVQGRDVRQMLGALNDALLSLVSGNDGSVDRLRRVETALHRTSQLNDLVAMKVSLNETLRMVREEAEQTRVDGSGAMQKLDSQLQAARLASQRLPGLPGRADAIVALEAAALPGADACLAVACQLERLRIIRSRYGAPIADELLGAFARSAAGGVGDQAYQWSDDGVVILHRTEEPALEKRSHLEEKFAQPFEYRVMTGGRAALLSAPVRWLCSSLSAPGTSTLTEEIDQLFTGRRWRT